MNRGKRIKKILSLVLCSVLVSHLLFVETFAAEGITTDPSEFYWSSSLGNQGDGVIVYDGEIYWCNRAYLATSDNIKQYDNVGWYIQLTSASGLNTTVYISEESSLINSEESGGYGYYLYKIDKDTLRTKVAADNHSIYNFFSGTVTVEMNGYVRIYYGDTTLAGPYNLSSDSNLATLLSKMQTYGFTTESQKTVETQFTNKILKLTGQDVITYSIEFNSGTTSTVSNMPSTGTKTYGVTYAFPSNIPTRTGYTFLYWKCDDYGYTRYPSTGTLTNNADRSFTAVWEKSTYSIEFNSGTTSTVNNMPSTGIKSHGTTYTFPSNIPTRTGYTFLYWKCDDYGYIRYPSTGTLTNNENRSFTAVWEVNDYTYTYDANGGSVDPESVTAKYGTSTTFPLPVRTGYSFEGWKSLNTGTLYEAGYTRNITTNVTFVAQWSVETSITDIELYAFEGEVGEGETLDFEEAVLLHTEQWVQDCNVECIVELDMLSEYLPNGFYMADYVEVVWGVGSELESLPYTYLTEVENMRVHLSCFPQEYSITYNLEGGTVVEDNPTTYNVLKGVSFENIPEQDGYVFVGWYIEEKEVTGINEGVSIELGSDNLYERLETLNIGDATVVAKWDKIPELEVQDVYMYLDAELEEYRFYKDVTAMDEESGDISNRVTYNRDDIIGELERLRELEITEDTEYEIELVYIVIDDFGNEVVEKSVLHVYALYEMKAEDEGRIRFIAQEYMETLDEDSVWRETEMFAYLESVLKGE